MIWEWFVKLCLCNKDINEYDDVLDDDNDIEILSVLLIKEDIELINLCQKQKLHTIIPTIQIKTSLYQEVKEQLTNSAIISIPITGNTKKELDITIKYIKSRGYTLEKLEDLLNENLEK